MQKLNGAGFAVDHQTGSHIILLHSITRQRITVPYHNQDLTRKTMKSIIKQTGHPIPHLNNLFSRLTSGS